MSNDLPTSFLVSAQIRLAAQQGVTITILQKGHENSGSILLKINTLDGNAEVLNQVHMEGKHAWMPASSQPMTDKEADTYVTEQISFDPDLWALEIEDKQGQHWFEGDVLNL